MQAGRLRHLVDIEHKPVPSPAYSATGESLAEWTALYSNIHGEWITLSGNALFAAQSHDAEVRGVWRIRWRAGITDQMRVKHKGLYYDIKWVPPYDKSGKSWDMWLECSQGVTDG